MAIRHAAAMLGACRPIDPPRPCSTPFCAGPTTARRAWPPVGRRHGSPARMGSSSSYRGASSPTSELVRWRSGAGATISSSSARRATPRRCSPARPSRCSSRDGVPRTGTSRTRSSSPSATTPVPDARPSWPPTSRSGGAGPSPSSRRPAVSTTCHGRSPRRSGSSCPPRARCRAWSARPGGLRGRSPRRPLRSARPSSRSVSGTMPGAPQKRPTSCGTPDARCS
jgi:hypothetical protein